MSAKHQAWSPEKTDYFPGTNTNFSKTGADNPTTPGGHTHPSKVGGGLKSLDSQVEDWLAEVVSQAGHSVVVPKSLDEAYKKIIETEEELAPAELADPLNLASITSPKLTKSSYKTASTLHAVRSLQTVLLDRDSLSRLGVPPALVDRLYRGLYVYTVGFHELIGDIHKHSLHAGGIATVVWQMFSHLLEQVEASDHKSMINEMADVHKQHCGKIKDEFDLENEKMMAKQRELEKVVKMAEEETARVREEALLEGNSKDALQRELEECVEGLKGELEEVNM